MKSLYTAALLSLLAATSSAQDPSVPESATNPADDTSVPERQQGQDAQEEVPVVEDGSASPPPPSSRFEPSEQISEDLSVSFPVDI
jgi:hypothetical protein